MLLQIPVRAVCKVYNGTSGQRVLANPITKKNSNVYLVLPFFFFPDVYKSLQKISE